MLTGSHAKRLQHTLLGVLTLVALLVGVIPANASGPSAAATLADLPLVEVPAKADLGVLAVHLTGDGGYDSTDRGIAQGLASQGIPVVALNTRKYFGTARTPESAAEDLARILRHYLDAWHARQFVTIGYSFGANVMPYLLDRLPQDLRSRLRVVALLAPTGQAEFRFHITEWLGLSNSTQYPVVPELQRLRGARILCFYGAHDGETIGPRLDPSLVTGYQIPGGHSIGKESRLIVEEILRTIRESPVAALSPLDRRPQPG
jgi:type IV secretory pathway VirJ component